VKGKEKGDGEGGGKERGREEERKGMDGKGFAADQWQTASFAPELYETDHSD